ncbi:unnamed protein product [Prorocentrum cordatum]|uniref:VTT domain-containing protein n=1 Tax=Prorocentrum cordatum TaxID=2364126 RepID=A0ABN9UR81_9DINO|nr:unnamed protein product [Polarella glacialis]
MIRPAPDGPPAGAGGGRASPRSPLLAATPAEPRRRGSWRCALGALWLVVMVSLSACLHADAGRLISSALAWASQSGWRASVYIVLGCVGLSLAMLPTMPLMLGSGALFCHMYGLVWGAAVGVAAMMCGVWLGSVCAFMLGRSVFHEWAQRELQRHPWMQAVERMIQEEGLRVVLLLRMSPILPADVFNYACAATSIPLYDYALGCLGSVVPISFWVVSAAQGTHMAKRNSQPLSAQGAALLILLNFVVFALLTVTGYMMYRKHEQNSEGTDVDRVVRSPPQDLHPSPRTGP